jgi:hypothetical protein
LKPCNKPLKNTPVKEGTSWIALVPPTVIGFTGLALLGRLGEFIRPYLIARQARVSFSSQIAVWTVERIFDLGAFTSLMVAAIFVSKGLRELSFYAKFRDAGFALMAGVAGLALVLVVIAKNGNRLADWAEKDRNALLCQLNSYLPRGENKEGVA